MNNRSKFGVAGLHAVVALCFHFGFSIQHSCSLAGVIGLSSSVQSSPSDFYQPPAFLDSLPPVYTEIARKVGMEGTVVVRATVSETGELLGAKISSGVNPLLNRAAFDALWGSTFTPAVRDGEVVHGDILVSYTFDLERFYREDVQKEKPPIDWTPPLISQVGDLIETRGSGEYKFGVYSYGGIKVYGDLTLALFEQVLQEVQPRLGEEEEVLYVRHPLVYKELGELGYLGESDLEVVTCTERSAGEKCEKGNVYIFLNQDGLYSIGNQNGTQRIWAH